MSEYYWDGFFRDEEAEAAEDLARSDLFGEKAWAKYDKTVHLYSRYMDRSKWRGGGRRGHGNKRSPGLTRRDGHDAPADSSSAGGGKANTHGARRGAHSSLAGTEEAQAHDADYFLPTYGPLLPEGLLVAAPSSVRAVGGSSAPTAPPSQALAEVVAVTSTDAGTVLSQGQSTQGAVTGLLNRRPPLRMNDAVQRMVRVAGKLGPNNPEHSHFHRGREGQAKANEVERRHTSDVLLGEVG